jgi:tetratricopeptide (TPR) repeat protein
LVDKNLTTYVSSLLLWEKAVNSKTDAAWESLRKGTADQKFISRLNAMPKEQSHAEAEKWVTVTVQSDPYLQKMVKTWKDLDGTRDAAAELAMIDLSVGQSLPPGPERTKKLQSAEHGFLELRKIGANNPRQELQLGQVYFWLGKEKEALEVLAPLEKTATTEILQDMGEVYRNLSRNADARRVLELAYDKGTQAEKYAVALTRSLAYSSREDRMAWLKKGDPNDQRIKMEIEQSTAEEDLRAGKYASATAGLQRVAAYYAGLPENATSLNNAALVQDDLAITTGDMKHVIEAARLLRKAHEKEPEDAIVLDNYLVDLERVGYTALAGTLLRPDLLHEYPGSKWMDYASPPLSPEEWAVKVKSQAELRRTAELGVRAAILAPESRTGIDSQAAYFSLTRDGAALRKLRETVAERRSKHELQTDAPATPPKSEDEDAKTLKDLDRGIFRLDATVELCRRMGHGPSLAFALVRRSHLRYSSSRIPKSNQTLELAIKDVDAAVAAFNAYPTRLKRAQLGMIQAALAFSSAEPDFAAWIKEDSTDPSLLLVFYAMKNPGRLETIRNHPAVGRTAEELAAVLKLGGGRALSHGWGWLDLAGHAARDEARRVIVAHPTLLEWGRLEMVLDPEDTSNFLSTWLAATAAGDKPLLEELTAFARKHSHLPRYFKP